MIAAILAVPLSGIAAAYEFGHGAVRAVAGVLLVLGLIGLAALAVFGGIVAMGVRAASQKAGIEGWPPKPKSGEQLATSLRVGSSRRLVVPTAMAVGALIGVGAPMAGQLSWR